MFKRKRDMRKIEHEKQQEEKKKLIDILEALKKEFTQDANKTKYRIREGKYLDILYKTKEDIPFVHTFKFSKDRKLLITNNGTLSLADTFVVGPISKIGGIDNTEYNDIKIISGNIAVDIAKYTFDNNFFISNKDNLKYAYDSFINVLAKILNDAAGNFNYPSVRANKEEEKVIDKWLSYQTYQI